MNSTKNRLKARVKARNMANGYANALYPILATIFCNFVGEKVLTAPGNLLAKIKRLIPDQPSESGLSVFREKGDYSLAWMVKVCEMVEGTHTCVYEEVVVYIGSLANGVLTEIDDPCNGRTNYTVKEVLKWREVHTKAKREEEKARSALFPFGEGDR